MRKNRCNAFVKETADQCKKNVLFFRKYCWLHSPKQEEIIWLIFGAFLGLLVSVIFTKPLVSFFSKVPFFCNLVDNTPPQIVVIEPNIKKNSHIETITKSFKIIFLEDGSGIDLSKSNLTIENKTNNFNTMNKDFVAVNGYVSKSSNELVFNVLFDENQPQLPTGEFLLDAILVDIAGNKTKFIEKFFVRRYLDLGVTASSAPFNQDFDREAFTPFFKKYPQADLGEFEIVHLFISTPDPNVHLRDLYLHITMPGFILAWKHLNESTGEIKVHATPSNQWGLELKEMDSFRSYQALVLIRKDYASPLVNEMNIWTSFVSEGYGGSETEQTSFMIPVTKMETDGSKSIYDSKMQENLIFQTSPCDNLPMSGMVSPTQKDYDDSDLRNALRSFQEGQYSNAITKSTRFISQHQKRAKEMQSAQSEDILLNTDLNDVSLALLIKADALKNLKRIKEAKEIYQILMEVYSNGYCWCGESGAITQPATQALQRLQEINK